MPGEKDQRPGIRLRSPVLGLLLAAGICLLTPYNNIYLRATPLGGGHFPLAPFVIFFLLAVIISILARLLPGNKLLTGPELLIIWLQMVVGSGIAYTGFARTFLLNLTAPLHFATVGNNWQEHLLPLLPQGLTPTDSEAVELLYNGINGGYRMGWQEVLTTIPWKAWLQPLLLWAGFILLAYLIMLMLINLLSRQWIHNERMNMPLLKVPEMISEAIEENRAGSFFTNRFLLAGLCLPLFLHLVNGLNVYLPSIPSIPTLFLAGPYFPDKGIFVGFQKLKIYFYPAFIGFAFLTSRQISFSFWFFFLFGCLLYGILDLMGYSIPVSELGITFGPTLTRPEEMQMIGAYGVFFVFLVWLARLHLADVCRQSFFLSPPSPSRSEWFDVRLSFWGVIAGLALMVCWFSWLGANPWTSLILVLAFYMIMIVATRIVCQGGLAYFTLTVAPTDGIIALSGTKLFSGVSGVLAGMSQKMLFVDLRESLMPSLLHGRHLHQNRRPAMLLFTGLGLTIVISLIVSLVATMALSYRYGLKDLQMEWATRTTTTVYENVVRLLTNPVESGSWVISFSLLGATIMLLLVACYHRFHWWPLHPLGYLTAYSSAMRILWVSFFLGWACNALCMRYGGITLFRKMQYFFIGMIIGDLLMGGGWAVIGLFYDMSYLVLPD